MLPMFCARLYGFLSFNIFALLALLFLGQRNYAYFFNASLPLQLQVGKVYYIPLD